MKTFYVGIKGVIIKNDKVLVLRANATKERRDFWEMPGGRIDNDENLDQTLRRELKEELPNILNVKIHNVLDAYRVPWDIDGEISLVLVFYKVTADFKGDPHISDEHIDWKWATLEEALSIAHKNCHGAIRNAFAQHS